MAWSSTRSDRLRLGDRCRSAERKGQMDLTNVTEADVERDAPGLWNLLNAVFHADWRDDFDDARAALDDDLLRYTGRSKEQVHDEVAGLLVTGVTDTQIQDFFEASGADLWVVPEMGMSARQFAQRIFDMTA